MVGQDGTWNTFLYFCSDVPFHFNRKIQRPQCRRCSADKIWQEIEVLEGLGMNCRRERGDGDGLQEASRKAGNEEIEQRSGNLH